MNNQPPPAAMVGRSCTGSGSGNDRVRILRSGLSTLTICWPPLFIAFSTANHIGPNERITNVRMLAPDAMTSLFRAAAEATEEAILNALCMAETMIGKDSRTIYALPLDRLSHVMRRYRPS